MALMKAPSEAAKQIVQALKLPSNTVAFTLSMRAGDLARLTVETYIDEGATEGLTRVLKSYRLQEIE